MRKNNKKNRYILLLLILVGSIGLGYAFLTQDLLINGISIVKGNNWKIYFDNVVVSENSITLSDDDHEPVINPTTKTDIEFTVTINQPGDFYEFTVDVINEGSIDAMIDLISNKLNGVEIDSEHPLPNYLKYTVTYGDGVALERYQLLEHSSSDNYKVRVEYNKDITGEDLPEDMQSVTLNFRVNYVQSDDHAVVRHLGSFETDSWETIINNVQNGKYYEVGATKEVELGNDLGTHILRVANNTNPEECQNGCVSQTACGFVLEFADIITLRKMNSTNTSDGGWPASEMRTYLNDENDSTSIINSLPTVLKNAIIDTNVISGHNCYEGYFMYNLGRCSFYRNDYVSTDKLYFLSTHEVFEDDPTAPSSNYTGMEYQDTAYHKSRQLDYYRNLDVHVEVEITNGAYINYVNREVTYKNYMNYSDHNFKWWFRSSVGGNKSSFYTNIYEEYATYENGVSPAFRLGGPQHSSTNTCKSFATDSWETIATNVQSGNIPSYYKVGDWKEIELGNGLGKHIIRIANTSTPAECSTEGFSQTGCGFVLEFADIVTNRRMNPHEWTYNLGDGNVGGWPASEMRTFLNDENDPTSLINSLPPALKNAIIKTTVISGHGKTYNYETEENYNYTTKDKIYLLSLHEIWENKDSSDNEVNRDDAAYDNTRQLDYYNGVNRNGYTKTSKEYNSTSKYEWWTRTPYYDNRNQFYTSISAAYQSSTNEMGVSPAFRLAGPESTYTVPCEAFEQDSWSTIISNVQSNKSNRYAVGCKKKVSLGNGLGEHILRVANNSTPTECQSSNFSQTACGFVLEFADVITTHRMNPYDSEINTIGNGNRGSWPSSEMRSYLNDMNSSTSVINSLPATIKNAIIDTRVISGYGCINYNSTDRTCTGSDNDAQNYVSTDKLYLLANIEVYQEKNNGETLTNSQTRQLDYYAKYGVTTSNYDWANKKYNTNPRQSWWLRNATVFDNISFYLVGSSGNSTKYTSSFEDGVSPAFRLG